MQHSPLPLTPCVSLHVGGERYLLNDIQPRWRHSLNLPIDAGNSSCFLWLNSIVAKTLLCVSFIRYMNVFRRLSASTDTIKTSKLQLIAVLQHHYHKRVRSRYLEIFRYVLRALMSKVRSSAFTYKVSIAVSIIDESCMVEPDGSTGRYSKKCSLSNLAMNS